MWSSDDSQGAPIELEPVLVVQLKAGWRHDPESGAFRFSSVKEDEDQEFDPGPELPVEARIEPMLPNLSEAAPESLSQWELELARYVHLFPGGEADLDELLAAVTAWECVEEAHLPPQISLP